jgi:glycine betaine/proline transport system substrate-binding protein
MMGRPVLPIANWIGAIILWMQFHLEGVFDTIKSALGGADAILSTAFDAVPDWVIIGAITICVMLQRRFAAALATAAALALIANLGLWHATTETLALVALAATLALLIGAPLGVLVSESRIARMIVLPMLDYMQTTPAFVYLIPAILFFGIGAAPGILATAVFAMPPVTRALSLGLEQVSPAMIEAARAFGATRLQILWRIKLPLARPYIGIAVNQCIMMALSMVVVCSLIGARGLGVEVITALAQLNLAQGIEAGVAVVLVAVVLDRLFVPPRMRRSSRRH